MKIKRLVPVFLVLFLYILFFTNAEYIKSSVYNSIIFCGKTLIPSVFPFILLSSVSVNSGAMDSLISHNKNSLLNKLGICKTYTSSVVLGSLSGYVTGAKCICDITNKNEADKNDFTNAVILSSNAGLGFVISCVGILIWESWIFGIYIYIAQILISGLLAAVIFPKSSVSGAYLERKKKGVIEAFSASVTASVSTVITIASYVIVFSLICDTVALLLPSPVSIAFYTIMEFCRGSFKCLEFSSIYLKAFFTGFTVGFGGICAHFQIFSVCRDYPLNKVKFSVFKLIQGILLGILAIIYIAFTNKIKTVTIRLVIFIITAVLLIILFKGKRLSPSIKS